MPAAFKCVPRYGDRCEAVSRGQKERLLDTEDEGTTNVREVGYC